MILRKHKAYLHFLAFLDTKVVQAADIHPMSNKYLLILYLYHGYWCISNHDIN